MAEPDERPEAPPGGDGGGETASPAGGRRALWVALRVLVAVVVILGAMYARVLVDARSAYLEAERSIDEGRRSDAIYHYRRAAQSHAPLNPWNAAAHDRLWQIGRKAELEGNEQMALEAYRAIRSSILACRSFYTPHPGRLEQVDTRIARLMARLPPPPVDRDKSETERMREHHDLLSDHAQPDPLWSLALLVGLFVWIGSCVSFVLFGLTRDLRVVRRPALISIAAFVLGMVVWVVGMFLA